MNFKKFNTKACCGKISISFKIGETLTNKQVESFIKSGFQVATHFLKCNILYADNAEYIITGVLGSDKLQLKCKISDCQDVGSFEEILRQME